MAISKSGSRIRSLKMVSYTICVLLIAILIMQIDGQSRSQCPNTSFARKHLCTKDGCIRGDILEIRRYAKKSERNRNYNNYQDSDQNTVFTPFANAEWLLDNDECYLKTSVNRFECWNTKEIPRDGSTTWKCQKSNKNGKAYHNKRSGHIALH